MPHILVTGGAGFIGCAVATALSRNPQNTITIVDNLSRGRVDSDFELLLTQPNVTFIQGDITTPNCFAALPTTVDYIYHLAAVIGVRNVLNHPDKVLFVNATSTLYLYEWAKTLPALKRILFSSTSEIYAGTLKHFPQAFPVPTPETVPLTLDDITSARTTYMLSKMYGESIAFTYGRLYNLATTIVRYHNVYGPRMGFVHVVPEMFVKIQSAASTGEPLQVFSPTHTRAMCFIDDAVEATILVAEHPATANEIINVGNQSQEVSIKELVLTIADVMGCKVPIQEMPDTPGSPARRCPDMSKLKQLTGYEPRVQLADGIRRTFAWYRDKLDQRYE
jgi:UDP-glucose 4-epimerase/UDP-glucuronate decarboxylase